MAKGKLPESDVKVENIRNAYTPEEVEAFMVKILSAIENENASVNSACDSVGISRKTFYNWIDENIQFTQRYKKAKEAANAAYWENIIKPKAKTALERLLDGEIVVERKVYKRINSEGEEEITEIVETHKPITTNPTSAIFANKIIYPELLKESIEVNHSGGVSVNDGWFMKLSIEKRAEIIKIYEESNRETESGENA